MKILLYFEGQKMLSRSGLARAYYNQEHLLKLAGFDVTHDTKAKDYDILYVHTYGVHAMNMIRKAKKAGKKVIIFARSFEEDFRGSFIGSNLISSNYKKYLIRFYNSADALFTPTPYTKSLIEGYGITPPTFVVSSGVNLPQYLPNALKENAFREIFGIQPGQQVVISVGHYYERKGIHDFIEVAKKFPNVRFMWLGEAPAIMVSPRLKKEMSKKIENVEFTGFIKGDLLEGALSSADVFFFPSQRESEGIVVLEALASKQKVLVRDIPAYSPWLEDEVHCQKGRTEREFVEKLAFLLENPCKEMRENAYKLAQTRSLPNISQQVKDLFVSFM
ncbi:MAG: glycosyltransferase family 4 protein [Streptococcaceae bacterium]|jgi:1,2-diacylglycerol-3-alpha-glucose alpha-1,2-glucosyltransferase|nr:glycosyltransferase family 4 protein [Streptococcaceae bacterium]